MKLEYKYDSTTTSRDNNGSLREQKITVPGIAEPFVQTYIYDDLNRLKSATETNNSVQTWKQTFDIDRYGNRKFDTQNNNTTTLGDCPTAVCNPTANTSDNRFPTASGYQYDANGNLTENAKEERFVYDTENHQTAFFNESNTGSTPDATYAYDGDGRRVKKTSGTEVTIFVYNASGTLVAEYSTAVAPPETAQVRYLTTDHLGSPRVVTNEDGVVKDRKDYSAFGEESISSQRSANTEYSAADQLRKNYTGYEKDTESGLEFAQARYYNPTHGRFTSVDPLSASASIRNPQSFNRYSYVLNSPYKFTDPLGLLPFGPGTCGQWCPNTDLGWGGNGGAFDSTSSWNSGWINGIDVITIDLNIVYDSTQMNEEAARKAVKDNRAETDKAFAELSIRFDISFTAGASNEERSSITTGAVEGSVNVFLYDNTRTANMNGSYFVTSSRQIFLTKVANGTFRKGGGLLHELGHLLRQMVLGDPHSNIPIPVKTSEGYSRGDLANYPEDWIINSVNDGLLSGKVKYGGDFKPGSEYSSTWALAKIGEMAPRTELKPNELQILRMGAKAIAAQKVRK